MQLLACPKNISLISSVLLPPEGSSKHTYEQFVYTLCVKKEEEVIYATGKASAVRFNATVPTGETVKLNNRI